MADASPGTSVATWLEFVGHSEYLPLLSARGIVTVGALQRCSSEAALKEIGLPLGSLRELEGSQFHAGPRKKLAAELHKLRMKELLAEAKREELYFEQQFPEGSEARKMFGHGTAF